MVVEPAGAAALAAVVADPAAFEPPVVVVLSGGNVDPLLLLRVIRHGLAAAGRYASLRLKIADRPGSLARLLHGSPRLTRTSSRSSTPGSTPGCPSTRSRSSCRSRRAVAITWTSCSPGWTAAATAT